jgi:hypothetical protein
LGISHQTLSESLTNLNGTLARTNELLGQLIVGNNTQLSSINTTLQSLHLTTSKQQDTLNGVRAGIDRISYDVSNLSGGLATIHATLDNHLLGLNRKSAQQQESLEHTVEELGDINNTAAELLSSKLFCFRHLL